MGSIQQHVYSTNLRQKFGYPLRNPRPNDKRGQRLGEPYGNEGFQVGDVGYVDDYGRFILVLNIKFPPKELLSQDPNFSSIEPPQFIYPAGGEGFKPDKVLGTGVRRDTQDTRPGYVFVTTSSEGAILILPNGASFAELQDKEELEAFREHAMRCAFQWCRFAKQRSLYLLTGVYKSNSWTLGSFYDGSPGEKIIISGQPGTNGATTATRFDWKCPFNVDYDYGPENNAFFNQTVLIKGFKITVKWDWPSMPEAVLEGPERRLLGRILARLRRWLSRKTIQYVPALNLSQPHHPLDVINHILLEKNPGAQVAITHDDNWIDMVKGGLSPADVMHEVRVRAFMANDAHIWGMGTKHNVVYLENNTKGAYGEHKQSHKSGHFSHLSSNGSPRLAIINLRLESVEDDRVHAGVCILVQFGCTTRRTVGKPHANVIEWDDEIVLPTDVPVDVMVHGVFQLSSMLGARAISTKHSIYPKDLAGDTHAIKISLGDGDSCTSLLITLGRQFSPLEVSPSHEEKSDFVENTNLGFGEFYAYRGTPQHPNLEHAIEFFRNALECCGCNGYRATALFNLATAEFIKCQAQGLYSELHIPIELYEEALRLRLSGHPDRPATLLLLCQALSSRYGQEYDDSILVRIKHLLEEIHYDGGRNRQTADAILCTCRFYQALNFRNSIQVDELLRYLKIGIYKPLYGYFDEPRILHKLGVAFWARYLRSAKFDDLEKSISLNEDALCLIPDGHHDRDTIATCLGSSSLLRRIAIQADGDLTDFEMSEVLTAATKLKVPKFYICCMICNALVGSDRVKDAVTRFHQLKNDIAEDPSVEVERGEWKFDFQRRCREKLDILGNIAMESENYTEAVEHWSMMLLLESVDRENILIKRNKARTLMGLWEEALGDADEIISLDPSSHRGYEIKHATLHGSRRDAEAVEAFYRMLSKLEESSAVNACDFECRCGERLEELGDEAMDSDNYIAATEYFSIILSLNPANRATILVKQSKAQALMGLSDGIPHDHKLESGASSDGGARHSDVSLRSMDPGDHASTEAVEGATRSSIARQRFVNAIRSVIMLQASVRPIASRPAAAPISPGRFVDEGMPLRGVGATSMVDKLKALSSSQEMAAHQALVRCLQFSPNGRYLATSSWDRTSVIFRVGESFATHRVLVHVRGSIDQIAWSPNGRILLTRLTRAVKVWSEDGICKKTIDRQNSIQSVVWLPTGDAFLSVEGSEVVKLDLHGRVLDVYHLGQVRSTNVAVTPDCSRLIGAGPSITSPSVPQPSLRKRVEKRIVVYNMQTRTRESQTPFSNDLRDIVIARKMAAVIISPEKAAPQLWQLEIVRDRDRVEYPQTSQLSMKHTFQLKSATDLVGPSSFGGRDDQIVLRGTRAGGIYIWDRETAALLHCLRPQGSADLTCIAWNSATDDPLMLAAGYHDGRVCIYSTAGDSDSILSTLAIKSLVVG